MQKLVLIQFISVFFFFIFKVRDSEENTSSSTQKQEEDKSDLDLTKSLFSIGHYIYDREEMLQQAFQSVSKEQIDTMMPDVLKVRIMLSTAIKTLFIAGSEMY